MQRQFSKALDQYSKFNFDFYNPVRGATDRDPVFVVHENPNIWNDCYRFILFTTVAKYIPFIRRITWAVVMNWMNGQNFQLSSHNTGRHARNFDKLIRSLSPEECDQMITTPLWIWRNEKEKSESIEFPNHKSLLSIGIRISSFSAAIQSAQRSVPFIGITPATRATNYSSALQCSPPGTFKANCVCER